MVLVIRVEKDRGRGARLLTPSASVATAQICESKLSRIARLAHFY